MKNIKGKLFAIGRVAFGLAASGGLGWLAAHGLDWERVGESLQDASYSLVALSIVLFLLASYLRAIRWQVLFFKEKISAARLFIVQNEGIGVNNVIPIRVASEATQFAVLTMRDHIKGATALATLGMERVIDLVASTFLLAAAFFLVPEMKGFSLYVAGAAAFTAVALLLVRLLSWGSQAIHLIRRIQFLAAFATAVRELERQRLRLAVSLLFSILYWLMVGMSAWLIAVAMKLPISPMTATLVIMGTIFFATAVPAAPSSVGTFEFAVVYVMEFFGVEREASFGFAVVTHAVLFLPPTIIAAVFLPREGVFSFRKALRFATRGAGHGPSSPY
jgi:hypothetical protein